jgi:hypothetical protein
MTSHYTCSTAMFAVFLGSKEKVPTLEPCIRLSDQEVGFLKGCITCLMLPYISDNF